MRKKNAKINLQKILIILTLKRVWKVKFMRNTRKLSVEWLKYKFLLRFEYWIILQWNFFLLCTQPAAFMFPTRVKEKKNRISFAEEQATCCGSEITAVIQSDRYPNTLSYQERICILALCSGRQRPHCILMPSAVEFFEFFLFRFIH